MSKINLETFKRLLSVKKGGAEFFRLVVKIVFWIFTVGAIFSVMYSLDTIQKQNGDILRIQLHKVNIEAARVYAQCQAGASLELNNALKNAKKEKKEVTEDEKKTFINASYNRCLTLSGYPTNQEKKK